MDIIRNENIFETFHSLPVGDKFIVKSDDSLDSQFKELEDEYTNVVEWEYIKEGPDEWEAVVSKKYYSFI